MARLSAPSSMRFGLSVGGIAAIIAVIVISISGVRAATAGQDVPDQVDPLPIATLAVAFTDAGEIEARYPALVSARRESALGFEAGGRIAQIDADIGDRVEAGAILARLDTRTLAASLAAARADVAAADARADLAELTLDRQRQLVEQGHISPQRLDEVGADARAARAQAAAAQAQSASLEVRLDLASIAAPFAGVVTARYFDEGAIAAPGAPVLHIVEDAALELRAGLPEREAANLVVGRSYPVDIDGRPIEATLRAVTGVIDARRRNMSAVFDLPVDAQVSSGAVARLVLPTVIEDRGFWAPVAALSEGRRGLWSVYVMAGNGSGYELEPRPVEIIHAEGDRVYLKGAVRDGERILSGGVHRVAPGQIVRPVDEG